MMALKPFTTTTLRPDYSAMIGSSYELQTAANRRALADLGGPSQELIGGLGGLTSAYNQAYGQARQANEARYREMLGISRGETQRQAGVQQGMLGAIGEETGQRAADIRAEGAGREAGIMQRLARQGMAGTTVAPTMREGVRRGTSEQLNRLSDLMLGRKLGVMGQIAAPRRGTELGIMERRTDKYPEQGLLTEALRSVGSTYGGQGLTAMISALSGGTASGASRQQSLGLPPGAITSLSPEQYRSKYGQ